MAETSVLREFLAVLGFKVDQASYSKFEKGLGEATKRVAVFTAGLETMAATVEAVVVKVADNLDEIYWASLRIGASAENIKAYEYAIGQLGGAARGARSALESVAYFIRSNPGGERWIAAMGVKTRDANGQLRDTERIMEDLGRRFASMPQYMAIRRAQMLGIDYNTLLAMERGAGGRSQEYRDFAKGIGVDLNQSAVQANKFMTSIRELRAEFGLLVTKIGGDLISQWGPKLREFLTWVGKHSSEIAQRVGQWVDRLARLGIIIFDVAMKVIGVIDRLDRATNGWSTTVGALLIVLWPLISTLLPLMMSQVGAIAGGIVALVAALAFLFNDMREWTQGRKSLIDWSPWSDQVRSLVTDVGKLGEALGKIAGQLREDVGPAFSWAMGVGIKWIDDIAKEITHVANAMLALRKGDFATAGSEAAKAWNESPLMDAMRTVAGAGDQLGRDFRAGGGPGHSKAERNLNPGNLTDARTGQFRRFATPEEGVAAMARQILIDYRRGQNTIRSLINDPHHGWSNQWSPGNSVASTAGYMRAISQALGVGIDTPLNMNDPAVMQRLTMAMARVEAGHQTYGADVFARGVGAATGHPLMAGAGGNVVTLNHKTDIHIDGAKDPHATGREVNRAQNDVWNETLRNAKGALR